MLKLLTAMEAVMKQAQSEDPLMCSDEGVNGQFSEGLPILHGSRGNHSSASALC